MQERGYIRIGGVYKDNEAKGSDWDYISCKGILELYFPVPIPNTTLTIGGEYENSNFIKHTCSSSF